MSRVKKAKMGKPTLLHDEMVAEIKKEVLAGTEIREIASKINVSERTIYDWKDKDYMHIGTLWNKWNTERMLKQAEKFSDNLMAMSTTNPDGTINKGLVAIQQKESEFLREKLLIARDKYNSGNVVNVNVALPQPIIDLSKVVSTVEQPKSIDK